MSVRTLVAAAALLALAAPAGAAPRHRRASYSPYVDREGVLFGFSLGAGEVGPNPCQDCGVGFAGELHLGATASYYGDVAVMLEAGGGGGDDAHPAILEGGAPPGAGARGGVLLAGAGCI